MVRRRCNFPILTMIPPTSSFDVCPYSALPGRSVSACLNLPLPVIKTFPYFLYFKINTFRDRIEKPNTFMTVSLLSKVVPVVWNVDNGEFDFRTASLKYIKKNPGQCPESGIPG